MSRRQARRQGSTGPMLLIMGGILLLGALVLILPGLGRRGVVDESRVEVAGQPSLRAEPESIDFGVVPLDTPKSFVFDLTNVGDEPLRLSQEPTIEVLEGC